MATKATTPEGDVGNPGKTVGLAKILDDLGVKYEMDIKDGAHDWVYGDQHSQHLLKITYGMKMIH